MTDPSMSAAAGCYHINVADGAQTSKDFCAVVPDQDCVISVLTGFDTDGTTAIDFKTVYNLTGKTLKAGTYIAVGVGQKITAVTITTGAAMCYNRIAGG